MKRSKGGVWVASNFNFLRRFGRARGRHYTVTLPNGERAKISINDARTVKQTEHGDHLDALVRPEPIRGLIVPNGVQASASSVTYPGPTRSRFSVRKAR